MWDLPGFCKCTFDKGVGFARMDIGIIQLEDIKDSNTQAQAHHNLVAVLGIEGIPHGLHKVVPQLLRLQPDVLLDFGEHEHRLDCASPVNRV